VSLWVRVRQDEYLFVLSPLGGDDLLRRAKLRRSDPPGRRGRAPLPDERRETGDASAKEKTADTLTSYSKLVSIQRGKDTRDYSHHFFLFSMPFPEISNHAYNVIDGHSRSRFYVISKTACHSVKDLVIRSQQLGL
jgi:hypothetical protein